MDSQLKKLIGRRILPVLGIVLLGIAAARFWKVPEPKLSAASPQTGGAKKPTAAKASKNVLRSLLAGSWYSADAEVLTKQFDGFFQKADTKRIENVIALILPHAGYDWSGQTAAFGLKTTQKQYKRIVVIGPSHRVYMDQILSVPRATHYETPLGQIPLDTVFSDKL